MLDSPKRFSFFVCLFACLKRRAEGTEVFVTFMIWQVFDLIRTRRTPTHSYTQTIMCVCLIGLDVLNE